MQRFDELFGDRRPDMVLAQGDTTTVMCAALASFYADIPFAHVEAGLRTFDGRNPFPEEFNRVAVTRLARLHFCPTQTALSNVLAEHTDPASAHLTGNTIIDALRYTERKLRGRPHRKFDVDILVTAHRRENFGGALREICGALIDLTEVFPDLRILYPVHPNPNVTDTVTRLLRGRPGICLTTPLDYPDLIVAMQQCKVILTDSGGIQEEAPALGRPVLVLRKVTERPEAVEIGVAKVIGTDRSTIVSETCQLLRDPEHYRRMASGGSPFGDGRSAARIRDVVCAYLIGTAASSSLKNERFS
jgi:UDP-N-acetylglucosamine 2-epimerase (non-hydrolysing)